MMTGKFTFLIVLTITGVAFTAFSQEPNTRELGLRFGGLNSFDIIYKKQKEENKYFRLRLARVNLQYENTANLSRFNAGLGIALGTEFRKPVAEKVHFVHGVEFITFFSLSHSNPTNNLFPNTTTASLSPGIGVVLGVQYDISERFYGSLETIPAFMLSFESNSNTDRTIDRFNAALGFDNAAAITLAYRF